MTHANVCCILLDKKKHKMVYKNVLQVTDKWNSKFKDFIGLYIYLSIMQDTNVQEKWSSNLPDEKFKTIKSSESHSYNNTENDPGRDPDY